MKRGIEIKMYVGEAVIQATKGINRYSERAQKKIRSTIQHGTKAVYDTALHRAPEGPTGNLRKGITFSTPNDWQTGEVKSTAPHSHLVEFGTAPRITYRQSGTKALKLKDGRYIRGDIYSGRMPKRPFMRPAIMMHRDEIERDMKEAIVYDSD